MDDLFKKIEQRTGVNMNDVIRLANSLEGADLQDERTVRKLVKQVSRLAGKRVNKQTEDMIVDTLVNKKQMPDMSTISKMVDKKRR
ncbi:MAG: stage VI sporulation protein F [Bacillaceae bacterium]|nr:stage VI sporulation protein F [Bacillaceae bacterium]